MAKDTPSMAKNKIKRSLRAICDSHPSKEEKNSLWKHFNSQCAYCGINIDRESKVAHLDHLVPTSKGGTNSIYNHALSCAICNGDEKREEEWDSFLKGKFTSEKIYKDRKKLITRWLEKAPGELSDPKTIEIRDLIITKALSDFDSAVTEMRKLRG